MGYSIGWNSKQELVKELTEGAIASRLVGGILYSVHPSKVGDYNYIRVDLLTGKGGEWGYKPLSESEYPYYFSCPESILKLSTCTAESAVKWREDCRKVQREQKDAKAFAAGLKEGDTFVWNGDRIEYLRHYHNPSYVVGRSERGVFKYKIKDIRRPA